MILSLVYFLFALLDGVLTWWALEYKDGYAEANPFAHAIQKKLGMPAAFGIKVGLALWVACNAAFGTLLFVSGITGFVVLSNIYQLGWFKR